MTERSLARGRSRSDGARPRHGAAFGRGPWALILFACFLGGAGPLLMPRAALRDLLVRLEPWSLSLHAMVLLFALGAAARTAWRLRATAVCRDGRGDVVVASLLCAAIGVAAALLLAPKTHRLYFDEDIYVQVGHAIAHDARAGMVEVAAPHGADPRGWRGVEYSLNKEPSGFPFLVAIASRLGFAGDGAGRTASLACFALGIMALGFLGRGAVRPSLIDDVNAKRGYAMCLAPFAYALWPENLRWATTSAADPSAAGLTIVAIALAEAAGRDASSPERRDGEGGDVRFHNRPLAVASALAVAFAAQQRPEGFLLFVPWIVLSGPRRLFCDPLPLAALAVPCAVPFWHLTAVAGETWGASGPRFSAAYVSGNLSTNLSYWFRSDASGNVFPPPVLLAPLAAIGIAGWARAAIRGGDGARVPRALLVWGALLFGVFLPFYAGSYRYGVDIRFSLVVVAPYLLAVVSGATMVGRWVSGARFQNHRPVVSTLVATLLIVPPLLMTLPDVARETPEAKQARADHAAVAVFARQLPRDAIVVAHSPSVWANHGVAAVQLVRAVTHPVRVDRLFDSHTVFYHEDYWDIAGTGREVPGEPTASDEWRALYIPEEFARVEAGDGWTFRLLKLRRRSGGDASTY